MSFQPTTLSLATELIESLRTELSEQGAQMSRLDQLSQVRYDNLNKEYLESVRSLSLLKREKAELLLRLSQARQETECAITEARALKDLADQYEKP